MTSFSMMLLHVDLNEAAKCVDIIPLTLLASLSRLRTFVQIQNGDDIRPNLWRFINQFMKVGGIKTWKELTIGVQQLVRLPFLMLTIILSSESYKVSQKSFPVSVAAVEEL